MDDDVAPTIVVNGGSVLIAFSIAATGSRGR
jgi:hypothetical protein